MSAVTTPDTWQPSRLRTVRIGHLQIHRVTTTDVVAAVKNGWEAGRGGVIVTPNADIFMQTREDDEALATVERCELVVADGMPLVWAARLKGERLPQRVTGSSLVEVLAETAAREGRSLFIVGGGAPSTSAQAAEALAQRYFGLRVVGAVTPPYGFEKNAEQLQQLSDQIVSSQADLVYVGLGFPKQERLSLQLREAMPATWFLGCGGGLQMAAGTVSRAPDWAQRIGAEWLVRLLHEPRRLARRYLRDDLPVAVSLLGTSAAEGLRGRWSRRGAA